MNKDNDLTEVTYIDTKGRKYEQLVYKNLSLEEVKFRVASMHQYELAKNGDLDLFSNNVHSETLHCYSEHFGEFSIDVYYEISNIVKSVKETEKKKWIFDMRKSKPKHNEEVYICNNEGYHLGEWHLSTYDELSDTFTSYKKYVTPSSLVDFWKR